MTEPAVAGARRTAAAVVAGVLVGLVVWAVLVAVLVWALQPFVDLSTRGLLGLVLGCWVLALTGVVAWFAGRGPTD